VLQGLRRSLVTFQPADALLANLGDRRQPHDALHDFTHASVAVRVLDSRQFDRVDQGFMPFSEAFQAFVDCYDSPFSGAMPFG